MPIIAKNFGEDAIEAWRARGATRVQFWCVGNPRCSNRYDIAINDVIEKWGPSMTLVMLARQARCRQCGKRGSHVQVTSSLGWGRSRWTYERLLSGMISNVVTANSDETR